MAQGFQEFSGNCPRSVSKDAKYAVRSLGGLVVVAVTYNTEDGERWLATTEAHPDLVDMVNEIKINVGGAPNGPFYINEFGQVIVPAGRDGKYYVAGELYDIELKFEFEGNILSGEGVDLQGRELKPGDLWSGPHPGIPYRLKAGADDIFYRAQLRPLVTKEVRLSSFVGAAAAASTAQRMRGVKGWAGGRIYVNEWKEIFAPVTESGNLEYRYIGHLEDDDPWFPRQ